MTSQNSKDLELIVPLERKTKRFTFASVTAGHRVLLAVLLFSILLLSVRAIYLNDSDILIDDAFISFRYASNFASGVGLVFNGTERVEGYSNFLWTVLLGVSNYIGLEMSTASKVLSAGAAVGVLLVLYLFSKDLFNQVPYILMTSSLPMLLFSVMGSQARYVVSGMETLLFVFLVTTSVYLFTKASFLLSSIVFTLAAMTRPEGLMYFLIVFGYWLIFGGEGSGRTRDRLTGLLRFTAPFILILGSYYLWKFLYYGDLLPNTYYAKASDFSVARALHGAQILGAVLIEWAFLPILLTALCGVLPWKRKSNTTLFALLILVTFLYFIVIGGDFVIWFGPRFLMPVLAFVLLLSAAGISQIADVFPVSPGSRIFVQISLSVVLFINCLWFSWPAKFDLLEDFKVQMRSWKELGYWMMNNLPSDTRIATDAAGLIPFYSGFYAIDMFGLTDPYLAHLELPENRTGTAAHEKFDPRYILSREPDCIVSTWIGQEGQPISAGLHQVASEIDDLYSLAAVAKVKYGAPEDGRWVINRSAFSSRLFEKGYQTGLYCLKSMSR